MLSNKMRALLKYKFAINTNFQQYRLKSMEPIRIKRSEVVEFCKRCMVAVKTNESHATQLAEVLAEADYRGHFSHGLNRIEMYVGDAEANVTNLTSEPIIVKETVSTALVDGNNCLGFVVGNFSMDLAIKKAKATGIGWVSARGSNHYGIAGYYSMKASAQGLLGLSVTNTSPLVFPTRSKQLALGTNPLTLAAPATSKSNEFVLDMATSTAAVGKIEMCRRKQIPIPEGWAADKSGVVTKDPTVALGGGLLPLGGREETGGYKGFGLSMLVEVFGSMLSGGDWGPNVRKWMDHSKNANLGQCFIAINPDSFEPGFGDRMDNFSTTMRSMEPIDPKQPVLVPGDPERQHCAKCDKDGIPYPKVLIDSMHQLADRLKVKRLVTLN